MDSSAFALSLIPVGSVSMETSKLTRCRVARFRGTKLTETATSYPI